MNIELSNDQTKMEIVSRLVKEGAIDFSEAIKLLEVETAYIPIQQPFTSPMDWQPDLVTYGAVPHVYSQIASAISWANFPTVVTTLQQGPTYLTVGPTGEIEQGIGGIYGNTRLAALPS